MVNRDALGAAARRRMLWLRRSFLAGLAFMALYLYDMQVLNHAKFEQAAKMNSMKRVSIDAPRGHILDRDGRILVKNRSSFELVVLRDRVITAEATVAKLRVVLRLDDAAVARLTNRIAKSAHAEVVVDEDLSLSEVARIEARAYEWTEFRIDKGLVRRYPHGSAAAHALGHMGEVRDSDLTKEQYRDYRAGDVVGKTGIEAAYEGRLRGTDGARWVQVNNRGRVTGELDQLIPPANGETVRTTLDLDVQRAAEVAFGDQRGAAVAIELGTGAVLAMVSRPAFDPNEFAGQLSSMSWKRWRTDPAHPLFDRALRATLAPGSVFKIVDTIAGLEDRLWDPDETITCVGRTVLHRDAFRCWRPGGHGPVSLYEALRGSCNVFFYHRGDAAGIERLAEWSRRLGLGRVTGIDIAPEAPGLVPDTKWKRDVFDEPWWPGETVSVAIGQGALQTSVLQVSMLMQIVASGAVAHVPYLVTASGDDAPRRPEVALDVSLRPSTLRRLRHALWAVVNEKGGTARRARVSGFGVSGKTGTAQAPDGPGPDDKGEHAWFAGYAPGENPVVVAAVYVERGGHGGETAAPIARAIFEAVIEKRGLVPYEVLEQPAAVVVASEAPHVVQRAAEVVRQTAGDAAGERPVLTSGRIEGP